MTDNGISFNIERAWHHIPFIKCTTDIDELEAQLEYPEDMLDSVTFTEAVWDRAPDLVEVRQGAKYTSLYFED